MILGVEDYESPPLYQIHIFSTVVARKHVLEVELPNRVHGRFQLFACDFDWRKFNGRRRRWRWRW
jgi:hypothetical protein